MEQAVAMTREWCVVFPSFCLYVSDCVALCLALYFCHFTPSQNLKLLRDEAYRDATHHERRHHLQRVPFVKIPLWQPILFPFLHARLNLVPVYAIVYLYFYLSFIFFFSCTFLYIVCSWSNKVWTTVFAFGAKRPPQINLSACLLSVLKFVRFNGKVLKSTHLIRTITSETNVCKLQKKTGGCLSSKYDYWLQSEMIIVFF